MSQAEWKRYEIANTQSEATTIQRALTCSPRDQASTATEAAPRRATALQARTRSVLAGVDREGTEFSMGWKGTAATLRGA